MNPPILHRKEVFLHPGHPQIETFAKLTKQEESHGLYKNPGTIGFKLNWEKLLKEKGLSYQGHRLIESQSTDMSEIETELVIDRHKTALSRSTTNSPSCSSL